MSKLLAIAALAGALAASAGSAATAAPKPVRADSILVKFTVPHSQVTRLLRPGDVLLGRTLNGVDVIRVKRGVRIAARIATYEALPVVVYAEPNAFARAQLAAPNDPSYGSQWALSTVDALAGWAVWPGSYSSTGGVTIAVVDTGVDSNHPDLGPGRVLTQSGANCVSSSSGSCSPDPALDDNGHGTHVAGIAAASTNNGTGVAGAAYSSPILPVKVLNASGAGSWAAVTNGILWASQRGARVINLSLGGTSPSQTLCDAVSSAIAGGALVVASAGNGSTSAPNYPAACPGAVGVAATDSGDAAAGFSNFGAPNVFVAAPGVSILSTYRGGSYRTMSGTSMAAPLVSGLGALLRGQLPTRTVGQLKLILATTSDKVGTAGYGSDPYSTCDGCTWSTSHGYGRINFERALRATGGNGDFSISASPPVAAVGVGGTASYNVSVTALNGFTGTVELSASGVPPNATATLTPASIDTSGSAELRIATSVTTPIGRYAVTITGTSTSRAHAATVTLIVGADVPPLPPAPVPVPPLPVPPVPPLPVPQPEFALTVTPDSATVVRPLATSYVIAISGAPLAGTVKLTVTGTPPGATAFFAPALAPVPGASTLEVATSLATPPGTYSLTVTGQHAGLVRTATATLVVQ